MKKLLESIDAIQETAQESDIIYSLLNPYSDYIHIDDRKTMEEAAKEIIRLREFIKTLPIQWQKRAKIEFNNNNSTEVKDVGTQPGKVKGDWDMQRFGDMIRNKK